VLLGLLDRFVVIRRIGEKRNGWKSNGAIHVDHFPLLGSGTCSLLNRTASRLTCNKFKRDKIIGEIGK
jgi:hypothetical protein